MPASSAAPMPPAESSPRPLWLRATIRVSRFLLALYLAWAITLSFVQPSMLYLGAAAGPGATEAEIAGEPGLERIWLERDGARVESWLIRTDAAPARGLVCFTHGNAELIDDAVEDAREWRRRGFDVLLPEYRGYGRSTGSPSQRAIVGDAVEALRQALARTGAQTLILHGRSLGTGVAAQLASRVGELGARTSLALVVLEAPFTSIASFAPRYGLPPFLVRDPYRTDEVLPALTCPVLILHTRDDEVVPIAHGRALASLAPARITLVEFDGGHNSGISMTRQYWTAVEQAAARAVPPEAGDRR